ncbi:MAG: hypothetical protein L6M37_05205 [Candidatus Methylarchaceae archaeon HK02M1]|nr:hypothetical protein [Candidatus Methylarchaceae archaeon HK01M]MCP8312330.1 hypothetical protein [Candidatus Methylarchaceae archaeon HK02M1]
MRPPCELVAVYLLPAFRSLVARELIEKHGFTQVAAANKLGTTQATISHYLYSKRGDKKMKQLQSIPLIQSTAIEVAQSIASEKISVTDATLTFCKLCTALKDNDFISLPEGPKTCLKTKK